MADTPLTVATDVTVPGGAIPPLADAVAAPDVLAGGDALAGAHDMSMLGLFLQADPIVKGVMILLFIASIACWAIILDKTVRVSRARRAAQAFAGAVKADALIAGGQAPGVGGAIIAAASREWRDRSDFVDSRGEWRDRIERAMRSTLTDELRRLEGGLAFLATVGSAAPFIGLFGTVWGIMNSFTSIAKSNDTSLAVVAPGIAEALFATAIGLVAAIPAVIAYNKLATGIRAVAHRFGMGIGELSNRLARERAGSSARQVEAAE